MACKAVGQGFRAVRNDEKIKSMLPCRHVDRCRRSAQFLCPASRRRRPALRRARHTQALRRHARHERARGGLSDALSGLFREEAERCLAFMPAVQGVVKWPTNRPGLAALVDELELPLTDSAVDRVLLVHALEMARDPIALLREVWRVLAGGGRLLIVVPNRRGVWARLDT